MFLNVWFMIVKQKFVSLLNLMTLIDNQVRRVQLEQVFLNEISIFQLTKLCVSINHQRQQCFVISFIIFMTFATFLFLLGEFIHAKYVNFFDFKVPACVFGFVEIQLNVLLNLQVVFLIWSVKVRYNAINKFLKLNFQRTNLRFSEKVNERKQIELLNETGLIHDHLVDVTNLINQIYGVPVIHNLIH